MACDNCLDNEFYQDKAEHYLQTYGIPINVSKQILKILYTSLDSCGLDCCDNIYSGQLALMQFQNEGTNLTQSSNVGIMNFVGAGVTASISGNVLTISISGGGGSSGLANGNYGDITVSNGTLTWTINNGVISTAKLADGAVTNNKLAVNSVTDTKIQNGAVSNAKLANNSVSNSKIQDGSITANKLAQMGATVGQVLKWNGSAWIASDDLTLGGGAVTQGANVGSGQGEIYRDTTGNTINFKKLNAAGNISIINNTDDITISTTSVGEANTASNLGVSGKSIFAQKVGVDLQLRRLVAGTNIVLTENANDITIDATTSGGGGSGSPVDAPYVTLGLSSGLSNERVLTQGVGITIVDGGANGLVTINATSGVGTGWALVGNSGTVAGTNFIGTTDDVDVIFRRNGLIAGKIGEYGVSLGSKTGQSGTNVAIGYRNLENATGNFNVAIGSECLPNVTTASVNTGVGTWTLGSLVSGSSNIAMGFRALVSLTSGDFNISIGNRTQSRNENTSKNITIGHESFEYSTGSNNIALGYHAARFTAGEANTIIGNFNDLGTSISAPNIQINKPYFINGIGSTDFTLIGAASNSLGTIFTATGIGIGTGTVVPLSTAVNSVAVGHGSLFKNIYGDNNTAIGVNALYSNTTVSNLVAVGYKALYSNTTGEYNTAIGYESLKNNTTGYDNTAIGLQALFDNTTGNTNTAIGRNTLNSNTIGGGNTANGSYALHNNTTGSSNTAIGTNALVNSTTADFNIGVGASSLYANTTGDSNTAIGVQALSNNTTGFFNSALGNFTLDTNETGSNNTALGRSADVLTSAQTYSTVIGAEAIVSTDNTIKLGRSTEDSVVIGQNGKETCAKLTVTSTSQGFLPPRMTGTQAEAISGVCEGLMVYATDGSGVTITTKGWWGYEGSTWVKLNT